MPKDDKLLRAAQEMHDGLAAIQSQVMVPNDFMLPDISHYDCAPCGYCNGFHSSNYVCCQEQAAGAVAETKKQLGQALADLARMSTLAISSSDEGTQFYYKDAYEAGQKEREELLSLLSECYAGLQSLTGAHQLYCGCRHCLLVVRLGRFL